MAAGDDDGPSASADRRQPPPAAAPARARGAAGAAPRAAVRSAPRAAPADFATNLGPKILVGAGGLAVVFFLAFFVRYAWENDWVGPTGRVLSGAVFSLGLIAGGLRIIGREYRPLGQGLAAAGFAGLYITAFAAHAVYGLAASRGRRRVHGRGHGLRRPRRRAPRHAPAGRRSRGSAATSPPSFSRPARTAP